MVNTSKKQKSIARKAGNGLGSFIHAYKAVLSMLGGMVLASIVIRWSGWYNFPFYTALTIVYGFVIYVKLDREGILKQRFKWLRFIR